MDPIDTILQYHETTKHHPHRSARSLGYMDWATQPDPFRRYSGAPAAKLRLSKIDASPSYDELYTPGITPPRSLSVETISEFFQYSLAISAWKEFQGSRWALRINPSSGNLHPTEGYAVIGPVEGLSDAPGVFHYAPKDHALERRCVITPDTWSWLIDRFPDGTFFAGLTSIHWREAWKYGERAYRYCQHDVGHALAALGLAAALQGWRVMPIADISDDALRTLLGLDRDDDFDSAEREHPDLLVAIMPIAQSAKTTAAVALPSEAIDLMQHGSWHGKANRLSSDHVEWAVIDAVADACRKPLTMDLAAEHQAYGFAGMLNASRLAVPARQIIQQRRSAVAMDASTTINSDQFYLMMDRVLPRFDRPPWCALAPPAYVHLAVFVHRVEDLEPGLYFLMRAPDQLSKIRERTRPEFKWKQPPGCPPSLPLYHLMSGDVRAIAGNVSCTQDIAAAGAFSLGMIAEFEDTIRTRGPWIYRRLFWETGMIGQVLYLEAEAAGIRGTGIGCFFDDEMHNLFGFKDRKYQSLYHFTIGGPVEDTRLTTLPPYRAAD